MEKGDSLSFKTKVDFVNLFWFHVEAFKGLGGGMRQGVGVGLHLDHKVSFQALPQTSFNKKACGLSLPKGSVHITSWSP